jgi:pimeloyl-ACP methyl ester carboxylesterase
MKRKCSIPRLIFLLLMLANMSLLFAQNDKPFENSHFFTIEGVQIHYRDWNSNGNSKGHILLIHGFSGSSFSWRNNVDTLIQLGYHIVAIDVPPFGYSSKATRINHSMTANAALFWKLADSLSHAKWVLVGHSMGASIAGAMAALRDDRTEKLIMVDGYFAGTKKSKKSIFKGMFISSAPMKGLVNLIASKYYFNYPKFKELLSSAYSQEADSIAVEGYLKPFKVKGTTSAILDLAKAYEVTTLSFSDVKTPSMLIWGSNDKWISIANAEKFMAKHPHVKYAIIKGAGHCSMETHSQEFNRLFTEFIAQ